MLSVFLSEDHVGRKGRGGARKTVGWEGQKSRQSSLRLQTSGQLRRHLRVWRRSQKRGGGVCAQIQTSWSWKEQVYENPPGPFLR